MNARLWLVPLMMTAPLGAVATSADEVQRITVRDTIALERFIVPDPGTALAAKYFSPGGDRFVVVTQRGVLETNHLRATVWLFDADIARAKLNGRLASVAPQPLLRMEGAVSHDDNNEGLRVISDVVWSSDGKAITLRARQGSTSWSVFRVDAQTGERTQITPRGQNVLGYAVRGDVVAYAIPAPRPKHSGDVVVGTGRSLHSLLFPDALGGALTQRADLWVKRNGAAAAVRSRDGRADQVVVHRISPDSTLLELSPDGLYLVATSVSANIPTSWTRYEAKYPWARLQPTADTGVGGTPPDGPEEAVIIDLARGGVTRIVSAPLARSLYWKSNARLATWSQDGRRVLLVNTFLPLEGSDAATRERMPSIIIYDVVRRSWAEVAKIRLPRSDESWSLERVAWSADGRSVDVCYGLNGPAAERYREGPHGWEKQIGGAVALPRKVDTPVVAVRENLNAPPALVASDDAHRDGVRLWDPNPTLNRFRLGEVRVFNWKDSTGRAVSGVLVLPPALLPGAPLVIEPRSYHQDRFVIDGTYSTAMAARAMTASGIVVLQAGEPLVSTDPSYHRDGLDVALDGYLAAIEALAAEGLVDRSRVGIVGFSRTALNALHAMAFAPTRFRAAIVADGFVYGPMQYFMAVDASRDQRALKQYARAYLGPPFGEALLEYKRKNVVFNLDRVVGAVRVEAHAPGTVLGNWEVYAGLRALQKPVDLIILPNASHVVSMPRDVYESQQGAVDWFRFWLKDEEDVDPTKAEQYVRWRAMRERHCARLKGVDPLCTALRE